MEREALGHGNGRGSVHTRDGALDAVVRGAVGGGVPELVRERRAARLRRRWGARGVPVPPVMVLSLGAGTGWRGLSRERIDRMFREAEDLGVSVILLTQGEPLLRPDILDLAARHPRIVFPFFTNGLLLSDTFTRRLRRHPHLMPVIGLDGLETQTDRRRGTGFHRLALERGRALRAEGVVFGVSLTATAANIHLVTEEAFVDDLLALGSRVFFLGEYEPVLPGTENLVPDATQRRALAARIQALRERGKGVFVSYPDRGNRFGGPWDGGGQHAPYVMDPDAGTLRDACVLFAEDTRSLHLRRKSA